jgi:hypothetical protein
MDKAAIENDGSDVFVTFNGVRIAKRGKPETPQARTWVSIEPGYTVLDGGPSKLVVKYDGKVVSF